MVRGKEVTYDKHIDQLIRQRSPGLIWYPKVGIGFHPSVQEVPYDKKYFEKYCEYEKTPRGRELTQARVSLVNKYIGESGWMVDFGCGNGSFVRARGDNTLGFDINPETVTHLKSIKKYCPFYHLPVPNASFWDSLEHCRYPSDVLKHVTEFAFVSIPIARDGEHAAEYRHLRPGEHYWHFTNEGFRLFAESCGFECLEQNQMESDLGREFISSYVLRRKS